MCVFFDKLRIALVVSHGIQSGGLNRGQEIEQTSGSMLKSYRKLKRFRCFLDVAAACMGPPSILKWRVMVRLKTSLLT